MPRLAGLVRRRRPPDAVTLVAVRRALTGAGAAPPCVLPSGPFVVGVAGGDEGLACVGRLVVAMDGRLDDRAGLARALGLAPAPPLPDAALVARALVRWGPAALDRLLGVFALAAYDAGRDRLLLARDVLGVRPLVYAATAAGLAFATDLPALLALPDVPRRVDAVRVADFLTDTPPDPARTFYAGLRRLPPGHALTDAGGDRRSRRYARVEAVPQAPADPEASARAFRAAFVEAVAARLRAAPAVGCALSGGLDSSAILGAAAALRPDGVDAFTLVFGGAAASDEREFAAAAVRHAGARGHAVPGDRAGPLATLDATLDALGEPAPAANLYLAHALFPAVRTAGVDVLLDGYLGDTVAGHGTERLAELIGAGRGAAFAGAVAGLAREGGWRRALRLAWRHGLAPWLPPWPSAPPREPRVAARALLEATAWRDRAQARGAFRGPERRSARGALHAALDGPTAALGFELIGGMGRAYGVEVRFPFADARLAALALAVPALHRWAGGPTRAYARAAVAPYVPAAIRERTGKTYLHHAFFHALLVRERSLLEAYLHTRLPGDVIDVGAVRALYARVRAGRAPQAAAWSVWRAVVVARWLEREAGL